MLLIIAAITLVVLAVPIYRLYFHPLAKYPGPLIGRITDWYSVYHCLKGDRYLDFIQLHERYGSIVRYGPNRLSFNTVGALQAIYGSQANTKKSHFYHNMTLYMKIPSTHATIDKAEHARKRRILAQALSDRMVHVYEDGFRNLLAGFLQRYSARASSMDEKNGWSAVFDMPEELKSMNYDSMGQFCFGRSFGALQAPHKADITEQTLEGFRGLAAIGHMQFLSWINTDAMPVSKAIKEYEDHCASIATESIERTEQKLRNKERMDCVFELLYAASQKPGIEGFTVPELRSESSLLVTTGTDTAFGSTANVLFHLLNNPQCMEKLTDEVRSKFTNIDEIRIGKTLNNCKYLSACIDEGMRLSPIVGGYLQREVGPGGIIVDGQHIPKGVDVGVPHHAIMRNPIYYEAPLEYRPERWLPDENNEEKLRNARAAYCPFLIGSTNCPGKAWALVEMKLTLAQMLYRYELQRVVTDDESGLSPAQLLRKRESESVDRFVVTNRGPFVRFREAKSN